MVAAPAQLTQARVLNRYEFEVRRAYKNLALKGKRNNFADQFHKRMLTLQPKLVHALSPHAGQQKDRLMMLVEMIVDKVGDDGRIHASRPAQPVRDKAADARVRHIVQAFVESIQTCGGDALDGSTTEWFEDHVRDVVSE